MVFACLGSSVLKIPLTSCHGGEKRVKGQSSESFELLFGERYVDVLNIVSVTTKLTKIFCKFF